MLDSFNVNKFDIDKDKKNKKKKDIKKDDDMFINSKISFGPEELSKI